ncbi:hypothetical protein QTP88_011877 [Uroleucon formosanum]
MQSSLELTAELTVLKKHQSSQKHQLNLRLTKNIKHSINSYFIDDSKNKLQDQIKKAEMLLCGFISKYNLSFNTIGHLSKLCQEAFIDSNIAEGLNISLGRTKATAITKNVIGKCYHEDLASKLKKYKFRVVIDESTDVGTVKNMAICVKYYDGELNKLETKFLKLVQLFTDPASAKAGATAEKLYSTMLNSFIENKVPLDNTYNW